MIPEQKISSLDTRFGTFDIATYHQGQAEDLIFLIHGLGCTKDSFRDIFNYPALTKSQILAVDLPGFGNSSKPQEFSYAMEEQAEVLSVLLKEISYQKIHLVVHSMGGAIGLLLADQLGRVSSFTNIEGNLISADSGTLSRRTSAFSFATFKDRVFPRLAAMSWDESKGAQLWAEQVKQADPLAYYRSCQSLVDWSDSGKLLATFQSLPARKGYVHGDRNRDLEIVQVLKKRSDIPVVEISQCGHFVMNDNPDQFYSYLAKVLSYGN